MMKNEEFLQLRESYVEIGKMVQKIWIWTIQWDIKNFLMGQV